MNNVGPFHNPAESYPYYSLPFCAPRAEVVTPHRGGEDNLGEVLAGDRRRASLYDIRFNVDIQWQPLCHFRLTQDEILQFQNAIRQHYMFEMFVDELPVKGFIGEIEETHIKYESHLHNETHIYLFTHLDFSIAYNQDRVIAVNLTTDPNQRLELELGKEVGGNKQQNNRTSFLHSFLPAALLRASLARLSFLSLFPFFHAHPSRAHY